MKSSRNNSRFKRSIATAGIVISIALASLSTIPAWATSQAIEDTMEGVYALQNAETGQYLANLNGDTGFVSEYDADTCLWDVKEYHYDYNDASCDRVYYQIRSMGSDLLLDIDNAIMTQNGKVKLCGNTGYLVQDWTFDQNEDGTVTIESFENINGYNFVFAENDGGTVIQNSDYSSGQKWRLTSHTEDYYKTIYSDDHSVIMQIAATGNVSYSEEQFRVMANKMARVYDALVEFHDGKKPYSRIIVNNVGAENNEFYAYVLGYEDNHIYYSGELFGEVQIAGNDNSDYGFGSIHEMGHLFDSYTAWDFDTEVLTDFRLLYVLEKLQGRAAPAGFELCDYNQLPELYRTNDGSHYVNGYSIFYTDYLLSQIQKQTGWDVWKDAFAYIEQNKTEEAIHASRLAKFDYLMEVVSDFAGCDVTQYLDANDYAKLREYLK